MADGQTQTMTPPPDPGNQVPDVKRTGAEKVGGFLGAISKGGALGSISDALERHHQKRLAEAKMYHDVMVEKISHPAYADEKNPEHQKVVDAYNAAKQAYMKSAGVDKETKQQIQQRTAIAEHHVASQVPPPPEPGAQQPTTAPSTQSAAPAPQPNAALPPPPKPDLVDIVARVPAERQAMEDKRAMEQYKQKVDIDTASKIAEAQAKGGDIKTTDEQWLKSFKDEHGREPSTTEIEAHQVGKTEKPIDAEVLRGIKMAEDGDLNGAQKIFAAVQQGAGAKKGPGNTGTSLMAVVNRANGGDAQAQKDLKTYMDMQKELSVSRGQGYGMGRAMYQIGAYVDPNTQQVIALSNYDAIQRIRAGENIVPSGRLPASMIAGAQRLVKESGPAIKEVRDNLKAYDNPGDRAIFARLMTAAGKPAYGDESRWLGNILNQTATENLSPEGKNLVVRLARLNETIGTLRQTLGSPATDRSMALMLGLLPGPSTPDSKMAGDMIDQLEQNVTNAVEIPALTGVAKPKIAPPPKPSARQSDPLGIR